ncbi:hypothetical protein IQ266_10055 [filamentous cyanobacterium LEGE 11480]|uniref:histidine kinase n=1 Tax=Romeriopsis navalis LEGE 11480 TaxID=2777977 RepID=A0A928VP52_9CYAN|nr:MHYT domain-containing protein [Romeriopsis navalis]MBE9030070.1 hypothetical protein [Romeriopsis navalis LEGE 11480]
MLNPLVSTYDFQLVAISIVIAILAAYTALTFANHVTQTPAAARPIWLGSGAIAMGTGIWSMHFVGMLAFQLPVEISYSLPIVIFSMLAAISASAIALKTVSAPILTTRDWLLSSSSMGAGISTMHYTGMAAMQVPAHIHYNSYLVSLSIGVAIVVSMIALKIVFRLCQPDSSSWQKLGSAVVMGAAIPLMHYIGMAAVEFSALPTGQTTIESNLEFLSGLVCVISFVIIGSALLISLEVQVSDRTASLSRSNAQLTDTLANLKQTQTMLVHSEKMSSIGEMVAGIAHEIKNPTTVLAGNMSYLKSYSEQLIELLEHCIQSPEPLPPAIATYLTSFDQEFVLEDYPKVIKSIDIGVDRVREIVLTLRSFSRMEKTDTAMRPTDLQHNIDSTLLLLHHRLKVSGIEVIRDYGEVPYVECLPGQINQVLLNIISNAIDALESRDQTRSTEEKQQIPSVISIRTACEQETAVIYIADNGEGMSATVGKQIFDAFYTTKSADQGTGLGLSVSYQIITEGHNGHLICSSEPGQGCEFQIQLPLQQNVAIAPPQTIATTS